MPQEDFKAFVRPMRLQAILSGSYLLIAIPPNRRIAERARNFRANLACAIEQQNYKFAGLTPYPARQAEPAQCATEDRRDSADLTLALGAR